MDGVARVHGRGCRGGGIGTSPCLGLILCEQTQQPRTIAPNESALDSTALAPTNAAPSTQHVEPTFIDSRMISALASRSDPIVESLPQLQKSAPAAQHLSNRASSTMDEDPIQNSDEEIEALEDTFDHGVVTPEQAAVTSRMSAELAKGKAGAEGGQEIERKAPLYVPRFGKAKVAIGTDRGGLVLASKIDVRLSVEGTTDPDSGYRISTLQPSRSTRWRSTTSQK